MLSMQIHLGKQKVHVDRVGGKFTVEGHHCLKREKAQGFI